MRSKDGLILLVACAAAALAQDTPYSGREYAGPSILGRGMVPSVAASMEDVALRPYIAVNSITDTGLISLNRNGVIQGERASGVEAVVGLYGQHAWKKTLLSIDYQGNYRQYSPSTGYDGTDQFLNLGLIRQLTKRTQLILRESGGTFTRNYFALNAASFFEPGSMQIPQNELLDNRILYSTAAADLIFQKTARLSFSIGGDGFLVRRRATSLYGVNGYGSRADISYRLSRLTTVGVDYQFQHFGFTRGFGTSDIHTTALHYAVRLSRNWELAARAGVARVESRFLTTVHINPEVAAIIGETEGIAVSYTIHYLPQFEARLTRRFRYAMLEGGYQKVIQPGNGLYLTSATQNGHVSYEYFGIRHWSFNLISGFGTLTALSQQLGRYTTYYGGAGFTRSLSRGLYLIGRFDQRAFDVADSEFSRYPYRATFGFAFSPGDRPLNLW